MITAAGVATLPPSWWLGGRSAAEAGSSVPPRWVAFVEQALADAPDHGDASGTPAGEGSATFGAVLAPFAAAAWWYGPSAVTEPADQPVDVVALRAEFEQNLLHRLTAIAARTLVAELERARTEGRLAGGSGRDRFGDFVRGLASRRGLTGLVTTYPVLARLLAQACLNDADAHVEIRSRLVADRAELVTALAGGVDLGPLVSLGPAAGDRHRNGRSVRVLTFDRERRAVYRPRPLHLHVHWNELVGWLDRTLGEIGLRTARVLARDGYGWVEFVAPRPCELEVDAHRFYRRLGALCALVFVLDGTDMHLENLIADGDRPVLVDVETLFHPSVEPPSTIGNDPAAAALSASVLRTAMLPQQWLGEHGALDISGVGGDEGVPFPFDVVSFTASGTDTMRLRRGPVTFHAQHNRPLLRGTAIDPADYEESLLAGFREAYDAIAEHSGELLGRGGLLARFDTDECRVILRPTELYGRLLDESTHPDVLRDGADRDRVFDLLQAESAGQAVLDQLVRSERQDLWNGDIPLFTARPVERTLHTSAGDRLPVPLPRSGAEAVAMKIRGLAPLDRDDQEWFIAAAIACRAAAVDHRGDLPCRTLRRSSHSIDIDPQLLLTAARGAADDLISRCCVGSARVNWNGVELIDDRYWTVAPLGAGLAYGYSGVAVFLAQLAALTGISRYRDLARDAIEPIPQLLAVLASDDSLAATVGGGGFFGLGGIAYALVRLADLLDDDEIRGWLGTATELLARTALGSAADHGVAGGTAGALATIASVAESTGSPVGVVEQLVTALRHADPHTPGFAHGAAGINWALRRCAATSSGELHEAGPVDDQGWCRGAAGVVLSRLTAPDWPTPADALPVQTLLRGDPLRDLSPCHGETGVLEALACLAVSGHDEAAAVRLRRTAQLLDSLDGYGPHCGTPRAISTPGFLNGLAGIGYGLLRLGFPESVPSVLLLEAAATPARRMSLSVSVQQSGGSS